MSHNLPRCERFLSGTEFETETRNEEWIGKYTAVGVDSEKKNFPDKCFIKLSLLSIKIPKPALTDCSLGIAVNTVQHTDC